LAKWLLDLNCRMLDQLLPSTFLLANTTFVTLFMMDIIISKNVSVKDLSKRLWELTKLTKQLIAIIIASFVIAIKRLNDYNKTIMTERRALFGA